MKLLISVTTQVLLSAFFCFGTAQTVLASRVIKGEPPSLNLTGNGDSPNTGPFDYSRLDQSQESLLTGVGTKWYFDFPNSDYPTNAVGTWMDEQFTRDQASLIFGASRLVFNQIHSPRQWGKITNCTLRTTRNFIPPGGINSFMSKVRNAIVSKELGPGSLGARGAHKYISYYLVIKKIKGSVKSDGSFFSGRAPVNWKSIIVAQSLEGSQRNYNSYVGLIGLNDHLVRSDGAFRDDRLRADITTETIFHELLHNFGANHSDNYADGEFMTEAEKCLYQYTRPVG